MSLLDDMLASGITLGDIVEYFSMEESRRDDVLGLIFENHSLCPFCDRYRKRLKDI
ncbi:hypothetical protein FSP39_007187 [Pinctada imbricata]|uniref:Uncharacterized protein n=1 Tax=Pinctada imbricata TaxID=66713 RepID=A0AA88XEX9_PINIB|nr:hypothetical protein FSP39_007187 [Pinctada imbricata]